MDHLCLPAYNPKPVMTSKNVKTMSLLELISEQNRLKNHVRVEQKCGRTPPAKFNLRLYEIRRQLRILAPNKSKMILNSKSCLKGLYNFGNTCHTNSVMQLIHRMGIRNFDNTIIRDFYIDLITLRKQPNIFKIPNLLNFITIFPFSSYLYSVSLDNSLSTFFL